MRSNNGGEYISIVFTDYLSCYIIHNTLTVLYTTEQNAVAERSNRKLMSFIQSMLVRHDMDPQLWAEAISMPVYTCKIQTRSNCLRTRAPSAY